VLSILFGNFLPRCSRGGRAVCSGVLFYRYRSKSTEIIVHQCPGSSKAFFSRPRWFVKCSVHSTNCHAATLFWSLFMTFCFPSFPHSSSHSHLFHYRIWWFRYVTMFRHYHFLRRRPDDGLAGEDERGKAQRKDVYIGIQ